MVCDVYENDLANVRLGDTADIRLNAYPDRVFKGRVSNIGAFSIRTSAPPRCASKCKSGNHAAGHVCHGHLPRPDQEMHTIVPASAMLHMHDRDFVFVPAPDKKFRRVEVVSGDFLPDNMTARDQVRAQAGPTGGHQCVGLGPRDRQ